MFIIYEDTEKDFDNNGLGILPDSEEITVHREINNIFSVNITYPLTGRNSSLIKENRIIKVYTPKGLKLFRIRELEKSGDRNIKIIIYATAIFFDLANNLVFNKMVRGNREHAINLILANTMTPNNFKIRYIERQDPEINKIYTIEGASPINLLLGDIEDSIQGKYGHTEVYFDDFDLSFYDEISEDTNILISYDKNITGITETLNFDDIATRIIPKGRDGLYLPETFIDTPNINKFYQPFISVIDFDIGADENTSTEQAIMQLREAAYKLINESNIDIPFANYTISYQDLTQTEEYKKRFDFAILDIGSKIKVYHKDLDLDFITRIISYDYDGLKREFIGLELGTEKKDLSMTINKITADIQISEEQIKIDMKNLERDLKTEISITAGELSSKISKGELYSELIQNPEAFQFLFSDVTADKMTISKDGILIKNDDGSYTKISSKGIEHLNSSTASNGLPYHYLNYTNEIDIACIDAGYTTKEINLPDRFKNISDDNISVSVSIQKAYKEGQFLQYWVGCYGEIKNRKIVIRAMSTWRPYTVSNGVVTTIGNPTPGSIIVRYTLIA